MRDPNQLLDTYNWFKTARPEPDRKDFHSQLGVHLEEVVEMLDELEMETEDGRWFLDQAKDKLHKLSIHIKSQTDDVVIKDPVGMFDSICDQLVTATGVGYVLGYDVVGGLNEVNRSNYSKFVKGKPIYNDQKKVMKGPDYSKANLEPFLG